ncbi:hypothetical protein CA85_17600 [Allorhodopirellula solitaria]|uniref:Uncharacterized protein n=1 Tax=Allorhodopirellula solitaria TaxID=2527987 RepID=A0A5C5YHU3_9BACT|nr:hypothetical protein CA85_17600 [Allorhodopirellula solitaria]
MNSDVLHSWKVGVLSLLTLLTVAAAGFALLRFSVIQVSTVTEHEVVFSCQLWEYRAQTSGLNAVLVRSSQLNYAGNSISQSLASRGFSIATPIGKFSPLNGVWVPHSTQPPWWSSRYKPSCTREVAEVAHFKQVRELTERGFYRTPVDGVVVRESWGDVRLKGTPSSWAHIERNGSGFWFDPERIEIVLAVLKVERVSSSQ